MLSSVQFQYASLVIIRSNKSAESYDTPSTADKSIMPDLDSSSVLELFVASTPLLLVSSCKPLLESSSGLDFSS